MKPKTDEDLHCTAPRCRAIIKSGAGNQWINAKGEVERWCWECWVRKIEEDMGYTIDGVM